MNEFKGHKEKVFKKTFVLDSDNCCEEINVEMFADGAHGFEPGIHKVKKMTGGPRMHGFAFGCGGPMHKKHGSHIVQKVKDDKLSVVIKVPGLDKDTIKLRAKADKLTFSGKLRGDLVDLLGEREFKHVVKLVETVDSTQANADYRDGVMIITFPVIEEGDEISL